jgi:hypothetical protein
MRGCAQREACLLVPVEPHLVVGGEAAGAARLDVGGDAAAKQLAASSRLVFPVFKRPPLRRHQGLVEHALEIAAVVLEAGGDLVRKPVLGNEVAAAEFGRVDAELVGRLVHQALDRVRAHRPARAAVGGGGDGVAQHELRLHMHRLHVVDAARDVHQVDRVHEAAGEGEIGAEVAHELEAHAEDAARGVERHLAAVHDVARLFVGDEHLGARADPLHRAPELFRREQQRAVFRVDVEAHPEAASDLLGDDADLLRRHAQHGGHLAADRGHALGAGVEVVDVACRVVDAGGGARLHRVADHPRVRRIERDDARGALERRLGRRFVAADEVEQQVAGNVLVQLRRAGGERRAGVDHCGQLAVFDRHRLGRVLRRRGAFGHHQRHRVADIAHAFLGERRAARRQLLRAAAPLHRRRRRQRLQSGRRHILAGEHGEHARCLHCLFFFNRDNLGVRAVRAHEVAVGLAGELPVGDVASPAGEHALVL